MSNLLERMANDLALPPDDLLYLVKSAPHRYKVYKIPKKAPGKKRTIAQPAREVKPLQYWVMKNVLAAFPIHPAAVAYRAGRSILDNAAPHAAHKYLCKLDFMNFFPSIKSTDFVKFMRLNALATVWSEEEIDYLSKILFWRKKRDNVPELSIGAPSSPLLSNILLFNFDLKIETLCARCGVTYTRYADDLSFSTNEPDVLSQLEEQVAELCKKTRPPRLKLNETKTVHASKKGLRRVTGLVLANDGRVSMGRERKREISAGFHRYVRGMLNEQEISQLGGMISFAKSVEPMFLQRLARKYGAVALNHLLSTHGPLNSN
ncbi:MAG: retron St85 family RNA-directed DNA polymerase [Acidobacteriaceae bacterium]